ncbi:MAG: hypothetical protein AB9869_00510 [Verrucomicrobiia bacterium]
MKMPNMNRMAAGLAMLSLTWATGLQAQQDSGQYQSRSSQRQSQMNQEQRPMRVLRGTVESVREAQWRSSSGQTDQRCIVHLTMENGRTTYVDVGSKSMLQDLDLSSGDWVHLRGRFADVGGREVFLADRIQVNGQSHSIQRSGNQGQQMAQGSRTSQSQTRTVQGRIDGFRHIYLRPQQGQRQQHSLAKLQLQDGRSLIVNLGPKRDLDDLQLEKGDRITLRGGQGTIDGRSVFFADQVRTGDRTVQIKRSGGQPSQRQARQQQQGREFTLRGKLAGYQVLTLDSGEKQLSMLNLRLEDGRSILIDAGQKKDALNLDELDLRDQVVIQGHTRNVQGRQILVADDIQFSPPQSQPSGVGQSGQQQQSSGGGSSGDSKQQSKTTEQNN